MDKIPKALFDPKSIAVVGVSSDPQKLGTVIFNNIYKYGYKGKVFAVNPKYDDIFGYKCFKSVSSITDDVDSVVIVVPATFVLDVVKDSIKKGVKVVIIISAGFKESGEEGKLLEDEIVDICTKAGVRIVGPNCLGLLSTESSLNASFAAQQTLPGNIGFLSQSGAFNTAMLDLAVNKLLGFRHFISLGNKADIDENSLLEDWYKDPEISVVGAYIEQFSDGVKFTELVSEHRDKPIILLNSGISEAGKKAASSHTGSLAGSARSIKTALKQAGVIQVDSIENMYSNLMIFSWTPLPKGNRIAIITNAGGPGIIMTDILSEVGLKIAELSDSTVTELQKILPSTASIGNPIDILGDALADRYEQVVDIVHKDPNVDLIILLLTPQLVTQIEETAKVAIDFYQKNEYPLIPVFIGEKYVHPGLYRMWENNIPAFQYDEEAVVGIKNLVEYATKIRNKKRYHKPKIQKPNFNKAVAANVNANVVALPADLVKKISKEAGLDTPDELISSDLEQMIAFQESISRPLVLKATTEDVAHKTDEKVIYLDIEDKKELMIAYKRLRGSLHKITGKEKPTMILQEMIKAREELILGVNMDDDFGHILLFGKGGIYTEVYNDTSTRMVYADPSELASMIEETRVSKVLNGARGLEKLPTDKVIKALDSIQKIVVRYPEIRSIDINPAMITLNRCVAVDIKMFI